MEECFFKLFNQKQFRNAQHSAIRTKFSDNCKREKRVNVDQRNEKDVYKARNRGDCKSNNNENTFGCC